MARPPGLWEIQRALQRDAPDSTGIPVRPRPAEDPSAVCNSSFFSCSKAKILLAPQNPLLNLIRIADRHLNPQLWILLLQPRDNAALLYGMRIAVSVVAADAISEMAAEILRKGDRARRAVMTVVCLLAGSAGLGILRAGRDAA